MEDKKKVKNNIFISILLFGGILGYCFGFHNLGKFNESQSEVDSLKKLEINYQHDLDSVKAICDSVESILNVTDIRTAEEYIK